MRRGWHSSSHDDELLSTALLLQYPGTQEVPQVTACFQGRFGRTSMGKSMGFCWRRNYAWHGENDEHGGIFKRSEETTTHSGQAFC